jgi:uncharacterized phiE125 gp8 family phage protein
MGIGLIELTAPTVEPVSVAEVKSHSRIGISDDDALIAIYITSARQLAEQKTGRSLAPRTLVRYYDEFPDSIELPKGPITSIDAVRYINEAGVLTTLSGAAYALDATQLSSWIVPAYGTEWPSTLTTPNAVQIQYQVGYSSVTIPASIKAYILLMVGTLYENRESASERPVSDNPFADALLARYIVSELA